MKPTTLPAIVLVHVNSPLPRYLVTHLRRLALQFPGQVVLISDSPRPRVTGVAVIHPIDLIMNRNKLSAPASLASFRLRRHLWLSSYQRLQLVGAFAERSTVPTIHIESDVVVLWPGALLQFAAHLDGVAYPLIAPSVGIASTMIISDSVAAQEFLASLDRVQSQHSAVTEMEYLGAIAKDLNRFTGLPRSPHPQPILGGACDEVGPGEIFDGAAMGVHLLGVDPIHTRGFVRTMTGITRDDLEVGGISWRVDRSCSNPLEICLYANQMRVATLHANSKERRLFSCNGNYLVNRISRTLEGHTRTFVLAPRALGEVARSRALGLASRAGSRSLSERKQ